LAGARDAVSGLRAVLRDVIDLLEAHGDTHVVRRLVDDDQRLASGDYSSIHSVIAEATGSMGALNDRIISLKNGDRIDLTEEGAVNARLVALVLELKDKAIKARAVISTL